MDEIQEVSIASFEGFDTAKKEDDVGILTKVVNAFATPFIAAANFICPKNPVTGNREFWYVPKFVEKAMGGVMYPIMKAEQGGETEHLFSEKCRKVMKKLAEHSNREFDYEVAVLKNNVVNAWCLPGGKVAVYKLLLEKIDYYITNKDKLDMSGYSHPETGEYISYDDLKKSDVIAALLGHEMTHADARHTARSLEWSLLVQILAYSINKYTKSYIDSWENDLKDRIGHGYLDSSEKESLNEEKDRLQAWKNIHALAFNKLTALGMQLYFLAGSRSHELEADKYGLKMAHKAGYNPAGALFLLEVLKRESGGVHSFLPESFHKIENLFRTHPTSEDRQLAIFNDVKHYKMGA